MEGSKGPSTKIVESCLRILRFLLAARTSADFCKKLAGFSNYEREDTHNSTNKVDYGYLLFGLICWRHVNYIVFG